MGARDLVLRVQRGGGLVPPGFLGRDVPQFSLYGDGTAVYAAPGSQRRYTSPRLFRAKLTRDQMQTLLRFALGPGRLVGARGHYRAGNIADAPTTKFTIDAAGLRKTVTVEALSERDLGKGDAADRAGMRQLADALLAFDRQIEAGKATNAGPYAAPAYRVTLIDGPPPGSTTVEWPLRDVGIDDFRRGRPDEHLTAYLTPEQAAALSNPDAATGVVIAGPAARGWVSSVMPLLPDESVPPR